MGSGFGSVVTSTDPTGGAGAWSVANVDDSNILAGVSCPSTSLCVAVGGPARFAVSSANVVTSTNPTGGAGAWSAPASIDGGSSLTGISCPSPSLCVAVDGRGNVVTSTDPTGGPASWTAANVDGANLISAVSCASSSWCVAVDTQGNVLTSTNPTGGASAWSAANVDDSRELTSVSCPSRRLCVAVDLSGYIVVGTRRHGH